MHTSCQPLVQTTKLSLSMSKYLLHLIPLPLLRRQAVLLWCCLHA